jgi:hypothetical protein
VFLSEPGSAIGNTFRATVNRLLTLAWRLRVRWGPAVDVDRPEQLTVVLVSYLRPRNLEPIIRSALKCRFVNRVAVQNNNPDIDLNEWVHVSSGRLSILNSPVRQGAGSRWSVALNEEQPYYLAIDDDVFLFPSQIARLFLHLLNDPSVPHGVHGVARRAHVARREKPVDVLHQLYLATADQVRRYHEILAILKEQAPKEREIANHLGDDIIISHCGRGLPRVHDVGVIPRCPSSHEKGIALNQLDEFPHVRRRFHRRVRELVADR